MAYEKTTWSPTTAITVARLQNIEDGVANAALADHDHELAVSDIPSLPASKTNSGTFAAARIPNLPTSKIDGLETLIQDMIDASSGTGDPA